MAKERAISTKELRIGNRLFPRRVHDPENFPIVGYQICAGHLGHSEEELNHDWEPIALTPAILEAFGFVKSGKRTAGKVTLWEIYEKGEFAFIACSAKNEFSYNGRTMPHIKYLHQLQNLIFCLTGKELEITLPLPS